MFWNRNKIGKLRNVKTWQAYYLRLWEIERLREFLAEANKKELAQWRLVFENYSNIATNAPWWLAYWLLMSPSFSAETQHIVPELHDQIVTDTDFGILTYDALSKFTNENQEVVDIKSSAIGEIEAVFGLLGLDVSIIEFIDGIKSIIESSDWDAGGNSGAKFVNILRRVDLLKKAGCAY
jgi:hypothetical protein